MEEHRKTDDKEEEEISGEMSGEGRRKKEEIDMRNTRKGREKRRKGGKQEDR